jgi:RNA polymerase primary sigma factor
MHALTESYNVVRVPLNMTHLISQIRKASAVIEQKEQRPATTAELAEALNTDEDKIQDALKHIHQTSSTDSPLTQDGDMTLGDTLSASEGMPDSSLEKEDMRIRLDTILKTLPPRERDILRGCYGLDGKSDSLEEIGQHYHLSRERVRQLRESTIKKLQRKYGSGK